jgi:hypothetical protein
MLRQFLKRVAKRSKAARRDCSKQRLHLQVPKCTAIFMWITIISGSLLLRLQGLEQQKLGLVAQLHLLQVNSRSIPAIAFHRCSMVEIDVLPTPLLIIVPRRSK